MNGVLTRVRFDWILSSVRDNRILPSVRSWLYCFASNDQAKASD
jgi:hypothetical protein